MSTNATTATTSGTAFSYIRFSTAQQASGDSLRRQIAAARDWCQKKTVTLDESVTFRDLGKSAYLGEHRSNPDRYALAAFLKLVEDGKIPRGSFLIIESLDRLTREHVRAGLMLLLGLIEKGIRIVQLSPSEIIYDERSDEMGLMLAIVELSRGHRESKRKSDLVGAAWAAKKVKARTEGHILTHKLPGWIREVGGKLVLIPERAAIVKRIFQMTADGYGHAAIVSKFTEEGIPAWGPSNAWGRSYLAFILRDRRALGEIQPRMRNGTKDGDVIAAYYPAVVTEKEFFAARAGSTSRTNNSLETAKRKPRTPGARNTRSGPAPMGTPPPPPKPVNNLFAGLIKNARDGDSYYLAYRTDGFRKDRPGGKNRNQPRQLVFVNTASAEGRTKCYSFPMVPFERAILEKLREIKPSDIIGSKDGPDEVVSLAGELASEEAAIAVLEAELMSGDVPSLARVLRQREERKRELSGLLTAARAKLASPTADAWGESHSLLDTLANTPDPEDTRTRLRSLMKRMVDGIWLLVVPRGRIRIAAVRINFADSDRHRDYLILYQPPKSNGVARTEAVLRVESFSKGMGGEQELDLRNPDHAKRLEKELTDLPAEVLKAMLTTAKEPARVEPPAKGKKRKRAE